LIFERIPSLRGPCSEFGRKQHEQPLVARHVLDLATRDRRDAIVPRRPRPITRHDASDFVSPTLTTARSRPSQIVEQPGAAQIAELIARTAAHDQIVALRGVDPGPRWPGHEQLKLGLELDAGGDPERK
jgi:hypothetical protein